MEPEPSHQKPVARMYREGDEVEILELFKRVLGSDHSMDYWRWRFVDGPAGPGIISLLEAESSIVGHLSHVPFAAFLNGERRKIGQGAAIMVAPGVRGSGLLILLKSFRPIEHGLELVVAFPSDHTAPIWERRTKSEILGRVPHWARWRTLAALELSYGRKLNPALRLAAALGLRLLRLVDFLPFSSRTTSSVDGIDPDLGEELDRLAELSAKFAPHIRVRDAAYLRWRWIDEPEVDWKFVIVRDGGGTLKGCCVFGIDSRSSKTGRLVDLLAYDARSLSALVLAATKDLFRAGAERVTCNYQDPRPWSRRAMFRSGFFPRSGGPQMIVSSVSEAAGPATKQLNSWYVTSGDTDHV